jgi:hypothetical protein
MTIRVGYQNRQKEFIGLDVAIQMPEVEKPTIMTEPGNPSTAEFIRIILGNVLKCSNRGALH